MRIVAGPCQHETLAQSAEIAKECKRVCANMVLTITLKRVMIRLIVQA